MAHNQVNQVDEILKDLQKTPGFKAYIILNNDGIVIRHTMESNEMAVQRAHHITELYNKSVAQIQDLFDYPEDKHVENVRMRTENYEMIVSSVGSYTLAVFQEETA
jgi:predicted regulator of Ras-like GTPase activity (Roadblock/LC7/MglB family)